MAVASSTRLALSLRSTPDMVPWSLYSCSPWSSGPQPLGSVGDAAERGLHLLSPATSTVAVWLLSVVLLAPGRAKSQVPQEQQSDGYRHLSARLWRQTQKCLTPVTSCDRGISGKTGNLLEGTKVKLWAQSPVDKLPKRGA